MGHVHEQQRAIYRGRNGPYTRATMGHICAHACPIDTLIYGLYICPLLLPNMAYYCSKTWPITALVQIRYKAWRFTAFLIVLIFVPLNGACIRAYMAIYGGIHGPHGSSNGACMRAYMAIYGGIHGPHGSSNGACMRAYMAIDGGIHGPHGSSNGACMRAYIAIYGAAL